MTTIFSAKDFYDENALFGEDYLDTLIAEGNIVSVGEDAYIEKKNIPAALKSFKLVEILDSNSSKYLQTAYALTLVNNGEFQVIGNVYVTEDYFNMLRDTGKIGYCEQCRKYHFNSDLVHTETGKTFCRKCATAAGFVQCADCGKWYPKSLVITIDGVAKCISCWRDKAYHCPNCGEWHLVDQAHDVYVNGQIQRWCDKCFTEHTSTCSECGHTVPTSELDRRGRCRTCRESAPDNRADIEGYWYHPAIKFYSMDGENNEGLYFGVELETEHKYGEDSNPQDFGAEIKDTAIETYCKHDGSLSDGAEVVTQPCSAGYHLQSDMWKRVYDTAMNHHMISHKTTTCGFHIHISRKPFLDNNVENYDAKIALAFEKFWDEWVTFSRRKPSQLSWTKRFGHTTIESLRQDLDNCGFNVHNNRRYHCVNPQNVNTLEIRLFRGTLRVNTIKATIWAVSNLAERILHGYNPEEANSFTDLFDMENAPDYFTEYLTLRGISYTAPTTTVPATV